ncbi:MAG TPA: hypothetical protein DEP72_08510 [Clostridiales bacterium]|nr:MAG: hypothetical protein A2Y18_07305 [Clostridiales bacterium GWD2_32_19]HCC08179.1 hypothetical protein [Clostridiales bacterium]
MISIINSFLEKIGFKNAEDAQMKVSAVVLCYNGERYLRDRISSIINQTSKPDEIVFLDDASTDKSLKLAKKILKSSKIKYRIIANWCNEGCARQIIRGINESKGDFVWIAEQDDYCSDKFLENIKKMYKDDTTNVYFCKSIPVDERNNKLAHYYSDEKELPDDFCADGKSFVENSLCIKNTVYNISSVVFKKNALKGVEKYMKQFKVFYDWIMYVYALREGKICYCSTVLNCHRRHNESIIAKYRRSSFYYEDLFCLKNYILDNFTISEENMDSMLFEVYREYSKCGSENDKVTDIRKHPYLGEKYKELQNKINERR